jgi:magnesium and cobalt transporter
LIADARATIEMLEERLGVIVSDEEREDIDTLGGLVFSLAGRVPVRGELISHPSGLEFEILDADPRQIKKLRLREVDMIINLKPGESRD